MCIYIYYLPLYTFFNFFFAEKFKKREIISDFSHNFIIFSKQKLSWFPFLSEQNQNDESLTSISSSHATRNLRFFWRNKPSRAHFESHRKYSSLYVHREAKLRRTCVCVHKLVSAQIASFCDAESTRREASRTLWNALESSTNIDPRGAKYCQIGFYVTNKRFHEIFFKKLIWKL